MGFVGVIVVVVDEVLGLLFIVIIIVIEAGFGIVIIVLVVIFFVAGNFVRSFDAVVEVDVWIKNMVVRSLLGRSVGKFVK